MVIDSALTVHFNSRVVLEGLKACGAGHSARCPKIRLTTALPAEFGAFDEVPEVDWL